MALSRRAFLGGLLGTVAAAATLDPDKLLWVPGAKTFFLPTEPTAIFLPSQTIIEAKTMVEALDAALVAVYPDGTRHEARIGSIGGFPLRLSHAEAVAAWIRGVEASGGKVLANRSYDRHVVAPDTPADRTTGLTWSEEA